MKLFVFNEPGDNGEDVLHAFTPDAAIRLSREVWRHSRPDVKDTRTDEEALDDFIVTHWAWDVEVEE